MEVFNNILETIGRTPIVKLSKIAPNDPHTYYMKLESFNPGQNIKDRAALSIIEQAEKSGKLKPGGTIIEATSGNTGLGLAMIASVKNYGCILVMPDKVSEEKRAILRAYGAKVVVCPTSVEPDDPRSYYSVCKKLVEITPNAFHSDQYFNPDNPLCHYESTGPEIWEQMDGKIGALVAGCGTGGTLSGLGKYFREKDENIKMVAIDPVGSILFDLFHHKEVRTPAHPYKIEGVGEDMLPGNVHFNVMDDFIKVTDEAAFTMCQELIAKEGLCVGPSSAMAVVGAFEYGKKIKEPQNIVIIIPDHGRAYLSKAFNPAWLKENGFAPSPMTEKTVNDMIKKKDPREVIQVKVGQTVMEVVNLLKENGISQVPVFSDNNLVGIIDESDLIMPLAKGTLKPSEPVIHLVKGSIVWVEKTDSLQSLAEHFQKGYVALVSDDNGALRILTKIDLLEYMGGFL